MTLTTDQLFGDQETLSQKTLGFRIPERANSRLLIRLQPFGDFFLRNRALFDHFPIRFGDINRGRARTSADAAIEYQIEPSIHRGE